MAAGAIEGEMSSVSNWTHDFDEFGFAIIRSAIACDLIERARTDADELAHLWRSASPSTRLPGIKFLERDGAEGERLLDGAQGVFKPIHSFACLRGNPYVLELLSPQLGTELVSVVDTLFFKPPCQSGSGIAFHRDAQFRRPPESFRDLDTRYVQVGFALESHGKTNGGLVVCPESHKRRDIDVEREDTVRGVQDLMQTLERTDLPLEAVELAAGDLVLWNAYTIHGSPPNRSTSSSRKFYVVGYMAADACDVGTPVRCTR